MYLHVIVYHAEHLDRHEHADESPVARLGRRVPLNGTNEYRVAKDVLEQAGFELGPIVGQETPIREWPLTALVYGSKRKDDLHRWATSLHRWPVRRRGEAA